MTTTRVTNTPERDLDSRRATVTISFTVGRGTNLEQVTLDEAKVLHMQLGDFIEEAE